MVSNQTSKLKTQHTRSVLMPATVCNVEARIVVVKTSVCIRMHDIACATDVTSAQPFRNRIVNVVNIVIHIAVLKNPLAKISMTVATMRRRKMMLTSHMMATHIVMERHIVRKVLIVRNVRL